LKTSLKIIECPRDAMQGLSFFVPTEAKIQYLNLLLKVGFDTLDFGSFVSPKAVPQMADTAEVVAGLDLSSTQTKLLAIVANMRGVEMACSHPEIHYLGFPLSISETFQQRNTNSGIEQGIELIKQTLESCSNANKELVVYLSMAFGNPYKDFYSTDLVADYAGKLQEMGVRIVSLADTVGLASADEVKILGNKIISQFTDLDIGMHLHSNPISAKEKLAAALSTGCVRIDTALHGLGGCPFAEDELVGNMPTETLVQMASETKLETGLDLEMLNKAKEFLLTKILI
jgi:hydroxymethylglutaryl-CoA lyase